MNPLHLAARNGPYVLVAGLAAGLLLPALAEPMRAVLPPLVALLLFLTVLRIEPALLLGSLVDLRQVANTVIAFQLVLPLLVVTIGIIGGWTGTPVFLSLLIMAAAPSISGSANMCLMMGHPAEHAMRLMVIGTAVLPLTVFPIFVLMPELGDFQSVLIAVLRLFLTISGATVAAVLLRLAFLRHPSQATLKNLEGLATITLAVFVIGLMPSVTSTALVDPGLAIFWVGIACLANFGAQLAMFFLTRNRVAADKGTALSIVAGNRNVAIFLIALPPEVTSPLLVFIGAYQIPMYLTPIVMRLFYHASGRLG
ncbi:hypothetical protein [Ruegeria atlantica]|uniref:Bile acid transporter n=1 Tax=Ruegeria atlantica TaxID=81569 RepID=A0A0P1EBH2_9RHOB|nr:hypothetical protein [Ruegeria atlantica]CUH46824.1 hypothetical protein RUA4292_00990 [Ruegeria atlantica]